MRDGSSNQRRVIRTNGLDGEDAMIVFQVTRNGYVAVSIKGSPRLHPMAVSRAIEHLRDLQAIALRDVQW